MKRREHAGVGIGSIDADDQAVEKAGVDKDSRTQMLYARKSEKRGQTDGISDGNKTHIAQKFPFFEKVGIRRHAADESEPSDIRHDEHAAKGNIAVEDNFDGMIALDKPAAFGKLKQDEKQRKIQEKRG